MDSLRMDWQSVRSADLSTLSGTLPDPEKEDVEKALPPPPDPPVPPAPVHGQGAEASDRKRRILGSIAIFCLVIATILGVAVAGVVVSDNDSANEKSVIGPTGPTASPTLSIPTPSPSAGTTIPVPTPAPTITQNPTEPPSRESDPTSSPTVSPTFPPSVVPSPTTTPTPGPTMSPTMDPTPEPTPIPTSTALCETKRVRITHICGIPDLGRGFEMDIKVFLDDEVYWPRNVEDDCPEGRQFNGACKIRDDLLTNGCFALTNNVENVYQDTPQGSQGLKVTIYEEDFWSDRFIDIFIPNEEWYDPACNERKVDVAEASGASVRMAISSDA